MTEKRCRVCEFRKKVEEFSGQRRVCKSCRAEVCRRSKEEARAKERLRNDERSKTASYRNYQKTYQHKHRLKKYGLTEADYANMVKAQDGKCKICQREDRLYVDHDHLTGRVRCLLCISCNSALGCFQDNPLIARRAVAYLEDNGEAN